MIQRAAFPLVTLVIAVLLAGCGDGQEGQRGYGAKYAGSGGVVDPGVLADLTAYQPQKPPTGASPAAEPARDASTSPEKALRMLATDLVGSIRDTEVEFALRTFEPAHVAALTSDELNPLFANFETLTVIAERLGAGKAPGLLGALRGVGEEQLKVDLVDASNAGVTPNVARVLFGPKAAGPALKAKLGEKGWKFQLDAPLSEADVAAIRAYHEKLGDALLTISKYVRSADPLDEAKLKAAAEAALAGEPVDLPVPEEAPATQPDAAKNEGEPPGDKPGDQEP